MGSDPAQRVALLKDWERTPAGRISHPEEDHPIPLMTAVGAAEDEAATRIYRDTNVCGGLTASSHGFG